MPDPELKLNSLARFSKKSPRLVLEEYSSCEVPAGCGGVVLRWRRPEEPVPMTLRSFTGNGRRERITLDGSNAASKASVPCGKHALTLVIEEVNPDYACVLLAAKLSEDYVRILKLHGDTILLSLPDGSWRYSLKTPQGDSWLQPDFDDSAWRAMVEKPFGPLPKMYQPRDIQVWTRDLTEQGARGLGIETDTSVAQQISELVKSPSLLPVIYIRKTFQILRNDGEEE